MTTTDTTMATGATAPATTEPATGEAWLTRLLLNPRNRPSSGDLATSPTCTDRHEPRPGPPRRRLPEPRPDPLPAGNR